MANRTGRRLPRRHFAAFAPSHRRQNSRTWGSISHSMSITIPKCGKTAN